MKNGWEDVSRQSGFFFSSKYCFAFSLIWSLRSFAFQHTLRSLHWYTRHITTFSRALPFLVAYITDDNILTLTITMKRYVGLCRSGSIDQGDHFLSLHEVSEARPCS